MPIYEFRCRDCGTITETLVFTTAQGVSCTCRNCGGKRTSKIISRPAAVAGRGTGGGRSDAGASAAQPWPGNDDFIRLKGQQ